MLRDVILGRAQSQISHEACFSPGLFKATEALISQKKKKKPGKFMTPLPVLCEQSMRVKALACGTHSSCSAEG